MRIYSVKNFSSGIIDTVEPSTIPDGAASVSLNWQNLGDRIQLRGGFSIIGSELAGDTPVQGLHVAYKNDGSPVLYKKVGRKLYGLDESIAGADWTEVGVNLFPAAAEDDECAFANYASLAGAQMFFSSPNSGFYKIMTANPFNYTDLTSSKNFAGYIKIKDNRTILWQRIKDQTGIYGSRIDSGANYSAIQTESVGTGNGATTHYAGTLAFKAGDAKRTAFGVAITDGVENFVDDYQGNLVGSLGGTGTINYMTGAYVVNFHTAPANLAAISVTYQYEDSTNGGVADFTKSGTRQPAEGFIIRQDAGGGPAMFVAAYNAVLYCLHKLKTWTLNISADDSNANNQVYREQVGIPNWRAAWDTADGIYYIDDTNESDPQFRILRLNQLATQVLPYSNSKARKIEGELAGKDLTGYLFDKAAVREWGLMVAYACRTEKSGANNRVLTYNKSNGAMDEHDYFASCLEVYEGKLIAGDSLSGNVYYLFSGYDDDDSEIDNEWEGNLSTLQLEQIKKTRSFEVNGLIQVNQELDVYLALDGYSFQKVGTVSGRDDYVDTGQSILIGGPVLGKFTVGGIDGETSASPYTKEIKIKKIGKFNKAKVRYVATGMGYVSVNEYRWVDIVTYGYKLPAKYRAPKN